jgi:hypothetical protein
VAAKYQEVRGGGLTRKTSRVACGSLAVPAELMPFSEESPLLPGESVRDFETIHQMMVDDVQPETNVEWLWTLDLVELSWEILRYRRLKMRILDAHRTAAIEAILQRVDGAGMPPEARPMVQLQAKRAAAEWRDDPEAAADIEARLLRSGIDSIDINAEVFVQARELFEMFDQLVHLAQNRRVALLREISTRREFARRARSVMRALDGLC